MRGRLQVIVSVALCVVLPIPGAFAEPRKQVRVGGEQSLDACGGVGVVAGLNPNGDNFLAVRSGPGSRYKMLDKIREGQMYFDCDEQGKWVGVVYSRDPNATCGVTSPIGKKQAYRGPCKSGWVFRKYTKLIAG